MTLNSDNAMARFLFAILKQKSLKDIDWAQVASDPVLLEPITNGHAARMRYSRFRATITGQAPKRRSSGDKSRVTKAKKDPVKKEKTNVKSAPLPTPSLSSYDQFSPASTSNNSPYIGETRDGFHTRFPTPFSDDMALPRSLVIDPAVLGDHELHIHNMPLFPPPDGGPDFAGDAGQDQCLSHSPSIDAFEATYDLDGYATGDIHGVHASNLITSHSLADCTPGWDDHFHGAHEF